MANRLDPAPAIETAVRARGFGQSWAMTLVLTLLCFLATAHRVSAQQAGLQPMTLHIGFTRSSFRNVNATDATAALRVFAQTVSRQHGYQLEVDVRLLDTLADCEAEIKKGSINMAILDTWDYLGMDIQQVMEPEFVHVEQGSVYKRYLLLTRRESGLTGLANLRGKDIMLLEGKGGNLSRAWLDSLLLAEHAEPKEIFFRKLETVTKPTAAVLPVFFGAKSACVVDSAAFQIMSELNPQVGSNLVVAAVSDPYLENVTCLKRSGWRSERVHQDIIQAMTELHLQPSGRQILELFKLDQMIPFKDEYLETARKLQRDLAALAGSQTRSEQ